MNKKTVGIVGVGNVGSSLAFTLATNGICDKILLKDIRLDFIKAIALDLSQASQNTKHKVSIKVCEENSEFKDCDIVVITAGIARKENMSREDLLLTNAKILSSILDDISNFNQDAIYIIVSNPLDAMVYLALEKTQAPRNKVLGMAGILDSARFKYHISEKLNFAYENIECMVIGSHSDTMLPLLSQTKVDGKELSSILNKEEIKDIIYNTKTSGAKIVELFKSTSAYFAPAYGIYVMCKAILNDTKEIYPCSVRLDGEYSFYDLALGVPSVLGKNGVENIVEFTLLDEEKEKLQESSKVVKDNIQILKRSIL